MWFYSRKSRSVNNSSSGQIWVSDGDSIPPGSHPEKTNPPPVADFSISPSKFNYGMQSKFFCWLGSNPNI